MRELFRYIAKAGRDRTESRKREKFVLEFLQTVLHPGMPNAVSRLSDKVRTIEDQQVSVNEATRELVEVSKLVRAQVYEDNLLPQNIPEDESDDGLEFGVRSPSSMSIADD